MSISASLCQCAMAGPSCKPWWRRAAQPGALKTILRVKMRIEPLTGLHERGNFRCGIPSFDKYLRAQAGRDAARNLAAIYVAELPGGKIAGYYALSSATVLLPDLLGNHHRLVSRYP